MQFFTIIIKVKNVIAVKDNFSNLFKLKIKFDVIVCRGVLQHTPKPLESIIQMKKTFK